MLSKEELVFGTPRMYPQIRIRRAWHKKTGDKINDAIGELTSTGNENVIRHFECVLCIYYRASL